MRRQRARGSKCRTDEFVSCFDLLAVIGRRVGKDFDDLKLNMRTVLGKDARRGK